MRVTAPPGVTLDLSFMVPGSMPSGVTFTRASTATYFDSAGTLQTAATNAPRWDYDPVTRALNGLLIEEARTNLLLNSATLGTQSATVTAAATTLSFYGTGTVTLSGVSTAGPLTGTGAANRVALTFTPTAGTLTLTVTGAVTNAQLETGAFATSYIASAGTAGTRAADAAIMAPLGAWFNASTGSLVSEFDSLNTIGVSASFSAGAFANSLYLAFSGTTPNIGGTSYGATGSPLISFTGIPQKSGGTWIAGRVSVSNNGGAVVVASTLPAGPYPWTTNMAFGGGAWTPGANAIGGHIRRVRYWPRALSNAELQTVTI